jgi:hypothetical protein
MFCKLLSRAFVGESDREVNVSRASQIISPCFHAPKHIPVLIIGKKHQSFSLQTLCRLLGGLPDIKYGPLPACTIGGTFSQQLGNSQKNCPVRFAAKISPNWISPSAALT